MLFFKWQSSNSSGVFWKGSSYSLNNSPSTYIFYRLKHMHLLTEINIATIFNMKFFVLLWFKMVKSGPQRAWRNGYVYVNVIFMLWRLRRFWFPITGLADVKCPVNHILDNLTSCSWDLPLKKECLFLYVGRGIYFFVKGNRYVKGLQKLTFKTIMEVCSRN